MPNPPGNSLGFNPNQKEIGPALTPLIDEVDQDQGLLEGEINQLIQTSKSLAGSLSSWTAQKPSDLLTLELQQTLLSDRGLAVFEIVLGKDMVFLNLPTFLCLPFGSDGLD